MTESRMILYRFSIFGEQKLFRGSILFVTLMVLRVLMRIRCFYIKYGV